MHITDGFVFLCQKVRKYGEKLLITPSKKNVKHFLSKVWNIIGKSKITRQEELIETLNAIIRGWSNSPKHRGQEDLRMDRPPHIWQMLWGCARRRHPSKGKRWVNQKYFPKVDTRKWGPVTLQGLW
ncbi:MAG: hypothetical protein M1509_05145 [Nitrospirae bacterium]|nr:hypothetical protein [Nitrospirota bacterium]